MVKTRQKIILSIGTALLVCALLWVWFVSPQLLKLPADFSFTADIVSVDDLYNEERKEFSGSQYSKTEYRYETVSAEDDSLVVKNIFDVRTVDDVPIFAVEREYGVDRKTGSHIAGLGDKDRDGYLFAPRHLKEGEPFTYWHINYDGPARMQFVGTEELYGLQVFRYETRYEGVAIDQTENLGFLPEVGETLGIELEPHLELWVEPTTGRLLKYQDDTVAYYYSLATHERLYPWNHFSNTFHEQSVKDNVQKVLTEKIKALIFEWYIPILLVFFGIVFIAISFNVPAYVRRNISLEVARTVAGVFITTLGLLVLIGWAAHIDGLIRIIPSAAPVRPLAALLFVILGLTIALKEFLRGRLSAVLSTVITLIALVQIAGFYGLIDFQIDLLLFRESVTASGVRVPLFTALGFLLLGSALTVSLLAKWQRLRMVEIAAALTLLLSGVALTGNLFKSSEILSYTLFEYVPLLTILLLALASIVVFATFREKQNYTLNAGGNAVMFGMLLASTLLTIFFTASAERALMRDARSEFDTEVNRAEQTLVERVKIYVGVLEGARGLLSASQKVERDEWKAYVDALKIQDNYPGLQGVGYSIFVTPEEREDHISQINAEGFPQYTIRPSGERALYSPTIYIEPFDERNKQAFGFDMFEERTRRSAMEQSRDSDKPKMSGRVTLQQEIDKDVQPGLLIYVAFYENQKAHETLEERRENIVGFAFMPLRVRNFVEGVIGVGGLSNIALRINDGTSVTIENMLYDDFEKKFAVGTSPRFEEFRTIYIAGRPWTLTYLSSPDFGETLYTRILPLVILAVGILISILITLFFYSLISSRERAAQYANVLTKDLREAKAKDEAMLASIGDGFVATDHDGKIMLTNGAFETLLGWSGSEVYGKRLSDVVAMFDARGKEIPESERLITKSLLPETTATTTTTLQYKRKDGTLFPVAVTTAPILLEGSTIGAVEVFRDITHEKEIDKAKTEFVSLASHQLRTPLSTVNWYTEMLLAGDAGSITDEQKKFLEEIYTGNQRMVELVNALLNVSRLELGTFVVEPEPTDIVKLAESVIDEQKPQINALKHRLDVDLVKDLPKISVDPKLFRMVFQNLLSNAVKYTPEGGTITFTIGKDADHVFFTLTDTGLGIPKDQQDKIFSKLFRADNVRESDTDGTGLGLYIVKSVVEQSGGTVTFESPYFVETAKGTAFHVRLPLGKKEG